MIELGDDTESAMSSFISDEIYCDTYEPEVIRKEQCQVSI